MSDIAWEARELLDGLDHYRVWAYEDMAKVLGGPDTDHPPLHTVTLSGDYMIGGWMEEGHARFAAASPRLVRELLAENERLLAEKEEATTLAAWFAAERDHYVDQVHVIISDGSDDPAWAFRQLGNLDGEG